MNDKIAYLNDKYVKVVNSCNVLSRLYRGHIFWVQEPHKRTILPDFTIHAAMAGQFRHLRKNTLELGSLL